MSKVKTRICDICGQRIEPNLDGFFIFPARRFYNRKISIGDKYDYPKDMCRFCYNKFLRFCREKREEYDEEE